YIRDITSSVELEEQLRWEKQRLANVIDGTGVGTWEWNVQTGETRFNERWAAMLGYQLADLEPVSINTWTRLAHPDDFSRSEDQLQRHFNGELEYYEAEAR
ncbi:PAS domain-containing protein, partial [Arthrospira platensis SPKY1]|nr:PAS domain-containing protein [Arthrospira platensis SPKY1]